MEIKAYKFTPVSERNERNPFFLILKIPQENSIDILYHEMIHIIDNKYNSAFIKAELPPSADHLIKVTSICFPAIVYWDNINKNDGSPIDIILNKSNTISLESLNYLPLKMREELSIVILDLIKQDITTTIKKYKLTPLNIDGDYPPFEIDNDELKKYAESTFKIKILDEDIESVGKAMYLQTLNLKLDIMNEIKNIESIESITNDDYQNLLKLYAELDNINSRLDDENKFTNNETVLNQYHPVEGGETIFYYLRLRFKGKKYYKVGVTLRDVMSRYNKNDFQYIEKILFEKKLTHANTIEQKVLKDFAEHSFPLAILSSGHTEVFEIDILGLDE